MPLKKPDESFSKKETRQRFEAALRLRLVFFLRQCTKRRAFLLNPA
jgi:hypothetical protein